MNADVTWMLDDILAVPEVRHAIVLSADGLLRARSSGIGIDDAEKQAAALSGLQSLSRSTAGFCGNPDTRWRQSMVEFEHGFVFVIAAGTGAYLAVSTSENVDMEAVSYQMHKLVDRLGRNLTTPLRQGAGAT